MNLLSFRKLFVLLSIGIFAFGAAAQQPATNSVRQLTAEDYARAEKMMGYNTGQLVDRGGVRPNWLPDERFWYRVLTPQGSEFILVDPARGTRVPAFDPAKLAGALSTAAGAKYEAIRLPFSTFTFS